MARRRRRHLLVPEARAALDSLKDQVIMSKTTAPQSAGAVNTPAMPPTQDVSRITAMQPGTSLLSEFGSRPPQGVVPQRAVPRSDSSLQGSTPSPGVGGVAKSLGIPYQPTGDNGNLTTRQAGRIGGQIGGSMVQRLISLAEQQLAQSDVTNPIGTIPNNRPTPQVPHA